MHVGIAHHYGWAVAVSATATGEVADRRRIELIAGDLPAAPVHHVGGPHEMHRPEGRSGPIPDDELADLVARVRATVVATTRDSLVALAADLAQPVESIVVRAWADDFPTDIATLRQVPWESRADSVMYLQVLAEVATDLGWAVRTYDAKQVEPEARRLLGDRAADVLDGPRKRLGAPWAKDHRTALAAIVVANA